MAWFQVDDQLAMHRKVCDAGNAAMGLWVRAGAWSMANLTEGFVSKSAAKMLGSAGQAKALVTAGLWVEVEGGYQFHEWGTRQMSAEQIAERRRKRAEAGRKGGQSKKGGKSEAKTEAESLAEAKQLLEQNRTPVPVPVLVGSSVGGNGTSVDASNFGDEPPPPTCSKHPNGTDQPCAACGRQREVRKSWDSNQQRAAQARRLAFLAEIDECDACDIHGWALDDAGQPIEPATRCPKHDWSGR